MGRNTKTSKSMRQIYTLIDFVKIGTDRQIMGKVQRPRAKLLFNRLTLSLRVNYRAKVKGGIVPKELILKVVVEELAPTVWPNSISVTG